MPTTPCSRTGSHSRASAQTDLCGVHPRALSVDARNYHTWSYHQWMLAQFGNDALWEGECASLEELLEADMRNGSALHHQFSSYGCAKCQRKGDEGREGVLRREFSRRLPLRRNLLFPGLPSACARAHEDALLFQVHGFCRAMYHCSSYNSPAR